MTPSTSILASLLIERQLEKVSPSWIAPKEEGRVSNSVIWVRSRRVLGWPGNGVLPCSEVIDAVECADRDDELE